MPSAPSHLRPPPPPSPDLFTRHTAVRLTDPVVKHVPHENGEGSKQAAHDFLLIFTKAAVQPGSSPFHSPLNRVHRREAIPPVRPRMDRAVFPPRQRLAGSAGGGDTDREGAWVEGEE